MGSGTARGIVVIGGLPGAGKRTLLASLHASDLPGMVALDSEQVSARLRDAGVPLPYRLVRPWVHGPHRLRVARALRGPAPVVVTEPLTGRRGRSALLRTACRTGRTDVGRIGPPDVLGPSRAAADRARRPGR
jgi:hypothetical protein